MIAGISLWRDCGFMEGAINVPSAKNQLKDPDLTIETVRIPSARLFDTVRVPVDYLEVCNMTYLQMVINDADTPPQTRIFYGWVDNVSVVSDSPNAVTEISWHVDLWRTWLPSAAFGEGVIVRKSMPATEFIPPQPYPHAYLRPISGELKVDPTLAERQRGSSPLSKVSNIFWVYLQVTESSGSAAKSSIICFPVGWSDNSFFIRVYNGSSTVPVRCPSLYDVIIGKWDEVLGLDPKTIKSAFISHYAPSHYTMEKSGLTYNVTLDSGVPRYKAIGGGVAYFALGLTPDVTEEITVELELKTTDTEVAYLCGFDHEVIGTVPWGFKTASVHWRVILSTTSAYVQVRAGSKLNNPSNAHSAGLCWTVPMIPLETTENATSTYNYSGARQADIQQIVLNADRARVGGHLGTASGVATGAITGAMSTGNPIGAAAGAGLGAVGNILSTEMSYHFATGEFMDREIGIRDYRAAHQSNGLIASGGGFDFIKFGSCLAFQRMVIDEYSKEVRQRDMNYYGAHVHIASVDCSAVISSGGPLQIENLHVTGPIPNTARRYIAERFKAGVYLND